MCFRRTGFLDMLPLFSLGANLRVKKQGIDMSYHIASQSCARHGRKVRRPGVVFAASDNSNSTQLTYLSLDIWLFLVISSKRSIPLEMLLRII